VITARGFRGGSEGVDISGHHVRQVEAERNLHLKGFVGQRLAWRQRDLWRVDGWARLRWDLLQQRVGFFGAKVYTTCRAAQSSRAWSPITATLISGARDAVLVDPLMTIEQGRALADWVAASGKNLTTV
jgi:hypothetical protein